MIGPDDQSGVGPAPDLEGSKAYVAQPSHTDLGLGEPGFNSPFGLHAGIDYPCSTREPGGPDPEKVRLIRHTVGDFTRGFVHPE